MKVKKIEYGNRSRLPDDELMKLQKRPSLYEPGLPYHWVLTYGWAIVGYYVKHETPLKILVAHANFYIQAHVDHGQLVIKGGSPQTEWRYRGLKLIYEPQVIHVAEYHAEVPHGPIMGG